MRFIVTFVGLALSLALAGCVTLGRESGLRVQQRLLPGMEKERALLMLSDNATIMSTSEFTKVSDGSWSASKGSKYQSASQYKADASVAEVESRTKREVVKMLMVDRAWGWMGWDVFLLYFDRHDRLIAKDMIHLD